ncbi:MAG: hypothetical protein A3H51_03035 [Candidatus Spechtbacteria bacterium RIFCSPLOWO2_02_FULL_38_8]|uniref:DUF8128 domain-containing protein n=1 Tax=Candidatus Spechtbacteria bacterium RIFCSPLOWO2_02_FULL_38_8 TaxID=1802164 RepID=A0A1G2HG61_9BACT|nr:MAG: hypothetical protein A3H51_03035 [Candidatus Spechtbacteria bacterium RIFCSPLOWO2_02_FULL_38_8]
MFQILKATWWIIVPVALFLRVKKYWLSYQASKYKKSLEWAVLEVILPPEVEKTPKAMENVLVGLHGAYKSVSSREKWTKGTSPDSFSLEMTGVDGELHFYVRCQSSQRSFVESKLYSQYPDAEIYEVKDYTKETVPPELPNKDYEVWGADYVLTKDWPYPILSYIDFEDKEEERRLDPLSQFAELVSKMEKGENIWLQIVISPVATKDKVAEKAKEILDKETGRAKAKPASVGQEVVSFVGNVARHISAKELLPGPEGKPASEASMQKLTPGEQEKVKKIEIKTSKLLFKITARAVYVARNDVFHKPHVPALQGFFNQFNSGINSFKSSSSPSGSLIFFKNSRNFSRKTKLVGAYRGRALGAISKDQKDNILNVEELATLYHFPGTLVKAPLMPRISSRTAEPPKGLPR